MHKMISRWIWTSVVILLIGGCSANQPLSKELAPTPTKGIDSENISTATPGTVDTGSQNVLHSSDPGEIKAFLSSQKIPNGDIYLENDKVHINIVGLTSEIEQRFAKAFAEGTYVLHDVKYTMQELLAAQDLLNEQKLYQKLNLYSSGVDTIGNKVTISIPSDYAEAAKLEIEKWLDPDMLVYDISELGEPHVIGEIARIDSEQSKRILILEPGNEEPSYWFSFNERSEMLNEAGATIQFKDLKVGQQVKLWSTGMVLESFPAQASVRRMELAALE